MGQRGLLTFDDDVKYTSARRKQWSKKIIIHYNYNASYSDVLIFCYSLVYILLF